MTCVSVYGKYNCLDNCSCKPNIEELQNIAVASTDNIVGTVIGNNFIINQTVPYSIDGYEIQLNDLILLKDQTDDSQNGIYLVIKLESGNIVLTRYCYFRPKCCNYKMYIVNGDTFGGSLWFFVKDSTYTSGDPINFIRDDGTGGDNTNATNVGGQVEVFKQKVGSILEFRTLEAGSNVNIIQNADTITISASGGGGSAGRSFNLEAVQTRVHKTTQQLLNVFAWDQSEYSAFTTGTCTFNVDVNVHEITIELNDPATGSLGSLTTTGTGSYSFNFTLPVADTYIEILINRVAGAGTNQTLLNGLALNFDY